MVGRRAQGNRNVVSHLVARNRDDRRVVNRAMNKHRDVGGAAADVAQADPKVLLVFGQHGGGRGQLLQDDVVGNQATAPHAFDDVLGCALRPGHDVHARFQAHARHANGLADAVLAVDDVLLRQRVKNLLVSGNRDCPGSFQHPLLVALGDLAVLDFDDAVRVEATHMAAGNPDRHRLDLAASHQLGFFDRTLHRLHRGIDVDHHAALQAARGVRTQTDHFDRPVFPNFAHQRHHFGGADVEPDDKILVLLP